MPSFPNLVADHLVELRTFYLKCGHCQRLVTKATAVIRRFPGIDVVSCHDCQFERATAALLAVSGEDNAAEVHLLGVTEKVGC